MLADGGATADWTLAADWSVAVGTVAAASVAAWLGVRAGQRETRAHYQAGAKARRQVFAVYVEHSSTTGAVEVVNGSSEVITTLMLQVRFDGNPNASIMWQWTDPLRRSYPTWPYLLAGQSVILTGQWEPWPKGEASSRTTADDVRQVEIGVFWADSSGNYWARVGMFEEAYESTAAMPFRRLPNFVTVAGRFGRGHRVVRRPEDPIAP